MSRSLRFKRRHHLEWIDLRQGVESGAASTEEERELLVLKVCLDEIKRSRPFLIVLLGDRYGWVPPADRMDAAADEAGFSAEVHGRSVTASSSSADQRSAARLSAEGKRSTNSHEADTRLVSKSVSFRVSLWSAATSVHKRLPAGSHAAN
jgi:hypothetical protein